MNDAQLYHRMTESPLFFIEQVWGLVPERDNEKFIKGKHLSWQQEDVLLAVEEAVKGEGVGRVSVGSGHGIGKSALLSWLVIWYMMTREGAQIPCTAPTSDQIHDVLWKEIAVWINRMPEWAKGTLSWSTGYIRATESPETWFARARTARKEAPEALAGIHGDHVMFIIDEASGVPEEIFKTAEGALTGENVLVVMTSNPTRLLGYFYDSHHAEKEHWQTFQFNSTDSPLVDSEYVERIKRKHGEESDEYRIRVLGMFPAEDAIDDKGYVPLLTERDINTAPSRPLVGQVWLGVDPSGEGVDTTTWVARDDFGAQVLAEEHISNPKSIAQKTMTLMELMGIPQEKVMVDNFGAGANVAQELAMANIRCRAVNVNAPASDKERYINKRAEAFWRLREWLNNGGELVTHETWKELLTIRYRRQLSGKIQMMSKQDMRKDGYPSPNTADALMLTFYDSARSAPRVSVSRTKMPKTYASSLSKYRS